MKRQKHLVLVTLALIGALLLLAGPVTARATETKFTATAGDITPGTPGRVWFSKQGDMEHIRALPLSRPITGDINGTVSIIHNQNKNGSTQICG